MSGIIDDYLIHEFNFQAERAHVEESLDGETPEVDVRLPMLLRVIDARWRPTRVPDCSIIARLGNTVACLGTSRTLDALQNDPGVLSVEASPSTFTLDEKGSIPLKQANPIQRPALQEKGDRALIAIIDNGIDVLHHAFRDATGKRTRILALWDQTDQRGPAPQIEEDGQAIGTWYTQDQINTFIAHPENLPASLKEMRARAGHGTHVASIAAGTRIQGTVFQGGIAPEAKLIVVAPLVMVEEGDPFSLGYSVGHTAALTFIRNLATKQNLPVVVNISQGMNLGAHDGTTLLETTFDEFTKGGRAPGFVIVKSAGNERSNSGHAELAMKSNQHLTVRWESPDHKDKPQKNTIELWAKACDELALRLKNPAGEYSPQVSLTDSSKKGGYFFSGGNYYQLSYSRYHRDNGESRFLVTITAGAFDSEIMAGEWALEVECGTIRSSGTLHAWIERNDSIRFMDYVNEEITLSIPSTAQTVISIGAFNPANPDEIPRYSSFGPTRDGREKPELCAPGDHIIAAKSNSLTGLIAKRGTSMAAPHVAGAIALLFSYWEKKIGVEEKSRLNVAQVRAAISQTTHNFNGHWTNSRGYGVLDIEQLFSTFSLE